MAGTVTWSSRARFILATTGFSVGLGNIWRFPYLAGENGGGAFVVIYVLCVAAIGGPIVVAELALGRQGRGTPVAAFARLASREKASRPFWSLAGGLAMLTAFMILSFYCVIGGWILHYIYLALSGALTDIDHRQAEAVFSRLLASPVTLVFWQGVFLLINMGIIWRGLHNGIERVVSFLMPLLFALLFALAVYGVWIGEGRQAFGFLFQPDFSALNGQTVVDALGQAFFSVGVGMAAMLTYGSYLPSSVSIPRTAYIIVFADTIIALVAGLAIFPFVFAYGIAPSQGPGLVFVALPAALASFGGVLALGGFFCLLAVAAITSSIALLEVQVAWGREKGLPRGVCAFGAALLCWAVGLATVFSFNHAAHIYPLKMLPGYETATFFDVFDRLTSGIGLPVGGFLVAVFAGRVLSAEKMADELGWPYQARAYIVWRFLMRWVLPLVIAVLLVNGVRE